MGFLEDWWNGKRTINPVALAWNSLPPEAKASYSSVPGLLAEMSPGASVRDAVEASGEIGHGLLNADPKQAALGAAGLGVAALGLLPGARAGKIADKAIKEAAPIRAYHGSPHDFDRFDLSKIGTGEGAQAYGHGLYFAENEGVARNYRDQLGKSNITLGNQNISPATLSDQLWKQSGNDSPEFLRGVMDAVHEMTATGKPPVAPADLAGWFGYGPMSQREGYAYAAKQLAGGKASSGSMYEVAIHADPAKFLDWDKPLSQQPMEIRNLVDTVSQGGMKGSLITPDSTGAELYHAMKSPDAARRFGYQNWSTKGPAEYLRDTEIPGIKYLDAGSRNAGDGSRNYVVFDDRLIEILRKYGLLPAAAGAAMAPGLLTSQGEYQ